MPPRRVLRLRLRELRENAGLSQEAVALALRTRRARISDLETGAVMRVDGVLLAGLCELFDVEPGALFVWERVSTRNG